MVQIVENWSDLEGKIEEIKPSSLSEKFVKVRLSVDHVEPVAGFANLLSESAGKKVTIEIPQTAAEELKKGQAITFRVRRAGVDKLFAHPDKPLSD